MRNGKLSLVVALLIVMIASVQPGAASAQTATAAATVEANPLDPGTLNDINALYRKLIDAENRHDLAEVRAMVWESPSTLFVAKTASAAEGNWAGFWGIDVVMQHFADLYSSTFVMAPDYSQVKTIGFTAEMAETYAPLKITVAYAGQTPVPKPFLMI